MQGRVVFEWTACIKKQSLFSFLESSNLSKNMLRLASIFSSDRDSTGSTPWADASPPALHAPKRKRILSVQTELAVVDQPDVCSLRSQTPGLHQGIIWRVSCDSLVVRSVRSCVDRWLRWLASCLLPESNNRLQLQLDSIKHEVKAFSLPTNSCVHRKPLHVGDSWGSLPNRPWLCRGEDSMTTGLATPGWSLCAGKGASNPSQKGDCSANLHE